MFGEKKTKEYLLEKGFVSVGEMNDLECLAKKSTDDYSPNSFAYFLINKDGKAVWDSAKTSSLDEINLFISIKEKLFN